LIDVAAKTLISYLLGSLLGGLIVGKLHGGVDIRTQGSGNAGGTNALRTQGAWFALWVMVIDVGKGWLAAGLLPAIDFGANETTAPLREWTTVLCATASVVGHVYPVWFGFRGGKGAATLLGVVLGVQPIATLVVLAVWLAVVVTTGFVGLSTILATVSFTLFQIIQYGNHPLTWFGVLMTGFVVFTHRANIERMRAGTENRLHRLWLLKPR
jgi:acyl phosphate:glycerol-3-phosphate acyltransferase